MEPVLCRPTYRPSGWVRWAAFLPLTLGVLATAVGMAWLLALAFHLGVYLIFAAPFIAALPVAAVLWVAVVAGHCRNRTLAAALGVVAGLVLYFGYYHFDLLSLIGIENAQRLDLLPRFVWVRMQTDRTRPAHAADAGPPRENNVVDVTFNWFFLLTDLAVAIAVPTTAAVSAARRAYSERHGRWMEQYAVQCPAAALPELLDALNRCDGAAFAARLSAAPTAADAHGELRIEYVPGVPDSPAYLTVTAVGPAAVNSNQRARKTLVNRLELEPAEAGALAARFEIPGAAFAASAVRPAPAPALDLERSGMVVSLTDAAGPRVLSGRNMAWAAVLGSLPLVLSVAGFFGLMGLALLQGDALTAAVAVPCIGGGFGSLLVGLFYLLWYGDYLPSRVYYRASLSAIRDRPDAIVDPDDPEAEYVQVIPRHHWGKAMVESATEVGLLRIDRAHGVLLYEGDRERWAIPGPSIQSCAVEEFVVGEGSHGAQGYPVAVLRATVGGRHWEAPLAHRHIRFRKLTLNDRRPRTADLAARISALVPAPAVGEEPETPR